MKLTCEDIFLAAVSSAEYVGEIMPGQHIQRVRNVSFFCLTRRLPNDIALLKAWSMRQRRAHRLTTRVRRFESI